MSTWIKGGTGGYSCRKNNSSYTYIEYHFDTYRAVVYKVKNNYDQFEETQLQSKYNLSKDIIITHNIITGEIRLYGYTTCKLDHNPIVDFNLKYTKNYLPYLNKAFMLSQIQGIIRS